MLQGATLQTINELQDTSMFVFEKNPTNPNTGICDIPTIANGGCQSPNSIDDPGFYTDDYTAGNSGPNTVTQQFFVDRRLTLVFWPQIVVDSNGFQSTAWFGAKSQDATVNRNNSNGAFIKQNSPDMTNSVTCGAVCFRRQANGSPTPLSGPTLTFGLWRVYVARKTKKIILLLLTFLVLILLCAELSIFSINLSARHRAEALLTSIRHLRVGESRSEVQWLLSEYNATASGFTRTEPRLEGLFSVPPPLAPRTPAAQRANGAHVDTQPEQTYFIYVFPQTVNRIGSYSSVFWAIGVAPWAVEVRLQFEADKLNSVTYSLGFGTASLGRPKELVAVVRLRSNSGSSENPSYRIGYDMRPSSILPNAGGQFRLGAVIAPDATEEQRISAFDFNLSCLSTVHGCRALCEVIPKVWKEAIEQSDKKEIILPIDKLDAPVCHGA
jgi:hypothetical protein